jgi:pimeloyl-ACP methyl ester carboxylesterase
MAGDAFESRFITAPDGLRLHVRDYGTRNGSRRPVLCLPGISRNVEDFEALAPALAGDPAAPRRVIAMDLRGRGRSEFDRNPKNYTVEKEAADVAAVLAALETAPAVIVGTSRGGLVAMALGSLRPAAIAGVVLNDVGPVIEIKGMMRIKGYVGRLPEPRSYEEGAEILRRVSDAQFPNLDAADWLKAAKRNWREEKGRLVTTYDPAITKTLEDIGPDKPLKTCWPDFDALCQMPLLVIHGVNSDILSTDTVQAMHARHPDMDVYEVPDQGHAPLLADKDSIARIAAFVAECDALYA